MLGTTGDLDAGQLVDLLVRQSSSPRFVASRIWTRFVSDTAPDVATMGRLVAAFGPGHDITALVKAAVREPTFRDPTSALVREPVL